MGLTTAVKNKCAKTRKEFKESSQVLNMSDLEQAKASSKTAPFSGETEVLRTNANGVTTFLLYAEDGVLRIYTKQDPDDVPGEFEKHSFDVSISDEGRQYIWY